VDYFGRRLIGNPFLSISYRLRVMNWDRVGTSLGYELKILVPIPTYLVRNSLHAARERERKMSWIADAWSMMIAVSSFAHLFRTYRIVSWMHLFA
jgi:hypothetical protein